MVFSSIEFLCFFLPVVILGYFFFHRSIKLQNFYLLVMSLLFYAFGSVKHTIVFVLIILISYLAGLQIHRCSASRRRLRPLIAVVSLLMCFSTLVYFKYFSFVLQNLERMFSLKSMFDKVALPIGISFYTFQCASYIIDVIRNERLRDDDPSIEPLYQRNLFDFALYVSFFPQLIAGPIVRYSDIRVALSTRTCSAETVSQGMERFAIGLTKKVILANILGSTATRIMVTDFLSINAASAWLGVMCYTLQIYYDFSGYSDMAIGLGEIFGFSFPENFNFPYIADSIADFWRRWHITLTTWFRDYIYIPLGGNRGRNTYINMAIVFLLTGIWHGAAWAFVLWGMWHGAFRLLELFLSKHVKMASVPAWLKPLKHLYTLLIVSLGWIPFKLESVSNTITYLKVMLSLKKYSFVRFTTAYYLDARLIFILIIGVICCMPINQVLQSIIPAMKQFRSTAVGMALKYTLILALIVICYMFVLNSAYNPFIYFRF